MKELTPYRKVAKQALMNWNGLSEEEADKKVKSESFDQLEGQVWATGSMNYAIDAIANTYACLLDEEEAKQLKDIIFSKENVFLTKENKQYLNALVEAKIELLCDPGGVLYILSKVHDGWVMDNASKFSQQKRFKKKYQHLPTELIGWKEAKADLLFIKPIFEAFGYNIDEEKLKNVYENKVVSYLNRRNITTQGDLARLIARGSDYYSALTETNSPKNASDVAILVGQVMKNNEIVKNALKSKSL